MKFSQLPVGSRFEYQGQAYRKISPILAAAEDGGAQRMIARSAQVQALDEPVAGFVAAEPSPALERERVLAAAHAYHAHCLEVLGGLAGRLDDDLAAQAVARELEQGLAAFIRALEAGQA